MRKRRSLTDEERYLLRSGKVHLSSTFTAETPAEKACLETAKEVSKHNKKFNSLEYYRFMNKMYDQLLRDI